MTARLPLKVCVVTASRSEYGLMRWLIQDLADDPDFSLDLVVTGSHLSSRHGYTVDEIRAAGHAITAEVPVELESDDSGCLANALAGIVRGVADILIRRRPDIVLVLGDRWEMLGVASACTVTTTPLGHFSGGEVTEGALDDNVRHAMTKLSHLHFVANQTYAARLRQLGEEDWRISVCGGPGLDNFRRLALVDMVTLSDDLGLDLSHPIAIVTFHPPTNSLMEVERTVRALVDALAAAHRQFGLRYVVTGPCADLGADIVETVLRGFITKSRAGIFVPSLGQVRYLSLLKGAALMIGNSSSAFHEAPMAGLWAVNVGDRQKGRLAGANVITVEPTAAAIQAGIGQAIAAGRGHSFVCPYGSGSASSVARAFLLDAFSVRGPGAIWRKRFVDLPER